VRSAQRLRLCGDAEASPRLSEKLLSESGLQHPSSQAKEKRHAPAMGSDPFAIGEDLHGARSETHLDFGAREAVVAFDIDVIVDADAA
jgi:hypothetical protein